MSHNDLGVFLPTYLKIRIKQQPRRQTPETPIPTNIGPHPQYHGHVLSVDFLNKGRQVQLSLKVVVPRIRLVEVPADIGLDHVQS